MCGCIRNTILHYHTIFVLCMCSHLLYPFLVSIIYYSEQRVKQQQIYCSSLLGYKLCVEFYYQCAWLSHFKVGSPVSSTTYYYLFASLHPSYPVKFI